MAELKNCTTNFYPEMCGINVVVDPRARLGSDDDRVLIIGQKGAGATAADNSVVQVRDATRAGLFGDNSMLNRMIDEFVESCPTAELYAYVLPNTGTAGEADVTITGVPAATASGIVYLWVNGRTYQASFDPSVDTNDTLAAKLGAVISANAPELTVTVAANVVTIATQSTGATGGQLDVRTSYAVRGDLTSSPEVTVAVALTAPTGVANLSGIAALTEGFEFVVNPYTDGQAITDVSAYLCSQWSGGANSRAYGVFYGDAPAAIVFGQNANNALLSYMATDGALTPSYLETASYGCLAYRQLNCQSADIGASMTGLRMPAMLAPEVADRYTDAEKAALVEAGVGHLNVTRVNDMNIGRAVTTYTVADNGSLDVSLRDVNKPAMIACISRFIRDNLATRYTGYAFRTDGIVGSGSEKVVTLAAVRNYMISLAQRLSDRNLVQNLKGFVEGLVVSYSEDTECITVVVDPELVKQFCCATVTLRTI